VLALPRWAPSDGPLHPHVQPKGVLTTLRGTDVTSLIASIPLTPRTRHLSRRHRQCLRDQVSLGTMRSTLLTPCSHRMDIHSVYLWVLPMFHAAGWTYPWAATFAVSTQIMLRNVSYPLIWNHLCTSSVTHYCGAPTVQVSPVLSPASEIAA